MRLESLILNILANDEEYTKKVLPHLKEEYFLKASERNVFKLINVFYSSYGRLPQRDVLSIELDTVDGIAEHDYEATKKVLFDVFEDEYKYDLEWLIDETETFCKEKSVYNAVMKAVRIINGDEKNLSENQIPEIMQEALGVSFDKNVGHDYFDDAQARYEFYHSKEVKITTSIDLLNKITNGGIPRKTLNLLMGPSGSGKSAVKCSMAADYLQQGYNVLYITLELAEERVSERIDANMLNIPLHEIKTLPGKLFVDRISSIKSKTAGKLIVKEYPTSTASVANFRILLEELKSKKGFVPDVLFVDYLGIVISSRIGKVSTGNLTSYTTQTWVAEELRALAVEKDMIVWSSIQTNRQGMNASDYDVEAMADSTGPLKTADLLIAIIRTDELNSLQQMILKQLKNRFGDLNYFRKFVIGMDFARMKMYNVENNVNPQAAAEEEDKKESKYGNKRLSSGSTNLRSDTSDSTDWDFES